MSRRHNKMSSFRHFNPHAGVLDLRRELRLYNVPIQLMLAGSHIELPTVPGARHDATGQLSFAQRPALMRADTIQREELSAYIKQRHDAFADDHFQRTAWRASVNGSDFMPRHQSH
jgi:hypothetical protein